MNESLSYLLTTLISLFAVIDPLGAIPVFLLLTPEKSAGERRRIALRAGVAVFLILSIGQTPPGNRVRPAHKGSRDSYPSYLT